MLGNSIAEGFTTPGTYKYIVTQETGSDSNTTYDKTVYNADVYVTENDSGVMNAETIVYKMEAIINCRNAILQIR